jgi:hypothetical protein
MGTPGECEDLGTSICAVAGVKVRAEISHAPAAISYDVTQTGPKIAYDLLSLSTLTLATVRTLTTGRSVGKFTMNHVSRSILDARSCLQGPVRETSSVGCSTVLYHLRMEGIFHRRMAARVHQGR